MNQRGNFSYFELEARPNRPSRPPNYSNSRLMDVCACFGNISRWGGLIIFLIIGIPFLIVLKVRIDKQPTTFLELETGALEYLAFNLAADPILDLRIVKKGSKCPIGFDSLKLGTWPGTVAGCDCFNGHLKSGACPRTRNGPVCKDVRRQKPESIYIWKDFQWCARRAALNNEYTKSVTCPSGFRQCSPGICVIATSECPITSVSINYNDTDNKLRVERELGKAPIIDLSVTVNDLPCSSMREVARGRTSLYKLLRVYETGCKTYGYDRNFSAKIDVQTEYDIFVQNTFPESVFNLPYYAPIAQETNMVLSARKRVDISQRDECLNLSVDSEEIERSLDIIKVRYSSIDLGVVLFWIIVLGIGMSVCFFAFMTNADSFSEIFSDIKFKIFSFCISFLAFVAFWSLRLVFTSVQLYCQTLEEKGDFIIKSFNPKDCFEGLMAKSAIDDYKNNADRLVDTIYPWTHSTFWFATVLITPSLMFPFWFGLKKCLQCTSGPRFRRSI